LAHDNGLGGSYLDCAPLQTFTAAAAAKAAASWSPNGQSAATSCTDCVARTNGTQCAVWCYGGSAPGLVRVNESGTVCLCPVSLSGSSTFAWD